MTPAEYKTPPTDGGKYQWIAAAENYFGEVGVVGDVAQRLLPLCTPRPVVVVREVPAEAVAAVHRAAAGGDQQGAPAVLVDHAGGGAGGAVADGIEAVTGDDLVLVGARQHLPQQGVVGIAMAHAGDESARYP